MRQRHFAAVLAAAAGVIVAVGPAGPASASKPAGPSHVNHHRATAVRDDHGSDGDHSKPLRLSGTVVSVDATAGTLTLAHPAVTLTVGSGAVVKLDGKTATLADIPAGARVQVQGTRTATATTVTKVQAHSPKTSGGKTGKGKKST